MRSSSRRRTVGPVAFAPPSRSPRSWRRSRRRRILTAIALGGLWLVATARMTLAVTPADPCALTLRHPGRKLDRHVSPALLARVFAPGQLRDGAIDVGEGETRPGTVVFPDDPRRRLSVVWPDRGGPGRVTWLMAEGASQWKGYRDIGIGTDLRTLERLSARRCVLAGFAWDYGGTVLSWRGGRLDAIASPRCRLIVRLAPPPGAPRDLVEQVIGDRELPSDHPAMRALNPSAYQLILELP